MALLPERLSAGQKREEEKNQRKREKKKGQANCPSEWDGPNINFHETLPDANDGGGKRKIKGKRKKISRQQKPGVTSLTNTSSLFPITEQRGGVSKKGGGTLNGLSEVWLLIFWSHEKKRERGGGNGEKRGGKHSYPASLFQAPATPVVSPNAGRPLTFRRGGGKRGKKKRAVLS